MKPNLRQRFCTPSRASAVRAGDAVVASSGKDSKETVAPEPRFKIYGWVEGGVTVNPDSPADRQNFSHFFDDRSNEPLLNQVTPSSPSARSRSSC